MYISPLLLFDDDDDDVGTSEVEHVLATQTLLQEKSKNMRVKVVSFILIRGRGHYVSPAI